LLTCISDTRDVREKAVAAVREARKEDKTILGIHMEGPHLEKDKRGVHKAEYLPACNEQDMRLYHREGDEIMLITVAAECVPPEQIRQLRQNGIIVSLGHTGASPEQIRL